MAEVKIQVYDPDAPAGTNPWSWRHLSEFMLNGTVEARPAAGQAGRRYYVTDAGAQVIYHDNGAMWVGGVGADTIIIKGGDQAIASAGWVDISGLTFAVDAGKAYHVDAWLVFQVSATTMGLWFGLNGPAAPSLVSLLFEKEIKAVAPAVADKFTGVVGTAYDTAYPTTATAESVAGANLVLKISGVFVNGNNAGTFALRLNKENVAGTGTIKAGSFLKYRVMN